MAGAGLGGSGRDRPESAARLAPVLIRTPKPEKMSSMFYLVQADLQSAGDELGILNPLLDASGLQIRSNLNKKELIQRTK